MDLNSKCLIQLGQADTLNQAVLPVTQRLALTDIRNGIPPTSSRQAQCLTAGGSHSGVTPCHQLSRTIAGTLVVGLHVALKITIALFKGSVFHKMVDRKLLPSAEPFHMGANHSLVPGRWWTRAVRTLIQWRTRRKLHWCRPPRRDRWRKASGHWSDPTARHWWIYWWRRPWSDCWWLDLQRHHEGYYYSVQCTKRDFLHLGVSIILTVGSQLTI